jgi:hypothetical protein
MKKESVSRIVGGIDDKYVEEAALFAGNQGASYDPASARRAGQRTRRFRWGLAAACIALVAVIGSATYAFAAENREYRTALAFFEDYGLSAEGLSRSDVKAVYRDIITKSFTNSKTADVMGRMSVSGWEILQEEPTPEELSALWDRNVWKKSLSRDGIDYSVDFQYIFDEKRGFEVLDRCVLECYNNGDPLWSAEFTDFYVEGYSYAKGITAVWGRNETQSSSDLVRGWVALVDERGIILWQKCLSHDFRHEYVASVLSNGDGTWAVFSRGDLKYLCLSQVDSDGTERSFHKTEVGNLGIRNAARLGDGYIVQLGNTISHENALLYRLDREGRVTNSYTYEADDCEYYLTDMTEFEGRIYLSAYAVPKQTDEGGRHEIADILDYIFSSEDFGYDITSEELTPLVRDNYTAVLLLCDPEEGTPKTFYSVKGSLGGGLFVNDSGLLEWDVESITSTFISPATSSFTVGGSCRVFRYAFDAAGGLVSQSDTGETVPYRR